MKKFSFSLERILSFKRTLFEKERNILAQMRAQRAALEKRSDDALQQMQALDEKFRAKAAGGGVNATDVAAVNYHRDNSDKLIAQLKEEIAVLDIKIEQQLKVVIRLDQDVKGLEKLREKQFEEYSAAAAAEERERILEQVSSRFIENTKNESG